MSTQEFPPSAGVRPETCQRARPHCVAPEAASSAYHAREPASPVEAANLGVDINFTCTQCGACCRNTKVPLTVAEAMDWLRDGNSVQIICEAWPWALDRSSVDPKIAFLKSRSFAAASGTMPTRVVATLVADAQDKCPNLLADQRCRIYERRPLVCRIYPAEINPFARMEPRMKACPSEAWGTNHPVFMRDGSVVSAETRRDIANWRAALTPDAEIKNRVCVALRLGFAAVAHEGFLVYSPPGDVLLHALSAAVDTGAPAASSQWRLVTDRAESVEKFSSDGALIQHAAELRATAFHFIGLKR